MRNNRKIHTKFHRLLRVGTDKNGKISIEKDLTNTAPETAAKLMGADFRIKNVLVGTVASREQFEANMAHCFYYAPVSKMPDNCKNLEYAAISLPRGFGDEGIKYYGKIKKITKVKRKNIPVPVRKNNPDEPYFYFEIEAWEHLPIAINPLYDSISAPRLTNLFLLRNSRYYYELFSIESVKQYILYTNLCRILNDISINDRKDLHTCEYLLGRTKKIKFRDGVLLVTDRKDRVDLALSAADFQKYPVRVLKQLIKYI